MSRQMRQFAIVSLAGVLVMAVILSFFYRYVAVRELETFGEQQNAQLAQAFSNTLQGFYAPLLDPPAGIGPIELRKRPEVARMYDVVLAHLRGLSVLKVKIYTPDGLTVFSTQLDQIGEKNPDNLGIQTAVSGHARTDVIYRDTFNSMDGIVEERDLIQTYFPIRSRDDNSVRGVFEVYSDVTPMMRHRAQMEHNVVLWVSAVLGFFYLVMFLLFRNMDRALNAEADERNQALLDLERINESLEERVEVRTRDLAASHQALQAIIDGVPDPVKVIDLDFRVTSMNRAAREALPPELDGFEDLRCFTVNHGGRNFCEGDRHPCPFQDVLRNGRPVTVTHEHIGPRGENLVVQVMASPLHDREGRIVGIIEVIHDVTDLARAIKLHQESELRFRDIAQAAGEYIWETDYDGNYTFLTERVRAVLGYSPEEMLGRKPIDFMPPDEAERIRQMFSQIADDSTFHELEHRSLTRDGRIVWQSISRIPIFDSHRRVIGYRGAADDVTRRKEALLALERSETHLRTLMDNVVDAILTTDELGQIEDFNPATQRMFGYRRDDLIGRNVSVLMDGGDGDTHQKHVERYLRTGIARIIGVGNREHIGRRKDGSTFPIDLWVGEMWLGKQRKFVGVIRDITERKKAETELEEARQKYFFQEKMAAVGQVAAGIIHEVGNPVAAIAGMAQELDDLNADTGLADADRRQHIKEFLDLIRQHTDRLTGIIREIADFTHPRPSEHQLLDLNQLVRSVARLLQFERRWRNVELQLDLDLNMPAAMGKADQLTQVIMNLLINSLDACLDAPGRHPLIRVETRSDGDTVVFSVQDNGSGMSPEVKQKAFDAFFTTKPVGKGTGLGLSLCHSIVSGHGGTIELDSIEGEGTRVIVKLPLENTETGEDDGIAASVGG